MTILNFSGNCFLSFKANSPLELEKDKPLKKNLNTKTRKPFLPKEIIRKEDFHIKEKASHPLSLLEASRSLAKAVYGGHDEKYIPSGWQQVDLTGNGKSDYKYNSKNGFAAAVYEKTSDKNEKILAYRGTNDFFDALNDLKIGTLIKPTQFKSAENFYKNVRKQFPKSRITITGHSLGGALAQYVGGRAERAKDTHYRQTYAFNGPGVAKFIDTKKPFYTVHNYINMGDVVGNMVDARLILLRVKNHVGDKIFLPPTPASVKGSKNPFNAHMVFDTEPIKNSNTIKWTFNDAYSLWWHDKTNQKTPKNLKGSIFPSGHPFRRNLAAAIAKLTQVRSPDQILRYTEGKGDYIIGTKKGEELKGSSRKLSTFSTNKDGDKIYGNEGNDVLTGSIFDDLLSGGKDNDLLLGGKGLDTYAFKSTDIGVDKIVDSDGKAKLQLDGKVLKGGSKITEGLFKDKTGCKYEWNNESDLAINDRFIVKGFKNGMFGIKLGDSKVSEFSKYEADIVIKGNKFIIPLQKRN